MRRAVAYLRVSSERQVGNTSIGDQAALARAWARSRDVEIVATFEDDGRSARVGDGLTESFDRRPGWCELAAYLRAHPARRGGPDLVIVKDYKRFSRDVVAAQTTIKTLRASGVEVQAIEQPIDWTVPEQKILLGLYLADGEVDNDRRAASTRRGMVSRLRDGVFIHHPPVGYRSVHAGGKRVGIEPDPATAAHVVAAFTLAADASLPVDASRQLLNRLVGRYVASKGRWLERLTNRVYAGEVHVPAADGRPAEWVPGRHDRIVPAALWAAVQARLTAKPVRGWNVKLPDELPLRGIVRSPAGHAHGGRVLTGSGPRGANGNRVWYYHTLGAGAYRIPATVLHTAVRDVLARLTPTPEYVALIAAVVQEAFSEDSLTATAAADAARRDVERAETRLARAAEAVADGHLDGEGYAVVAARARTLRDDARARIEQAAPPPFDAAGLDAALAVAGNLAGAWDALDALGRRELTCSIWGGEVEAPRGRELNTPNTPLVALLTGDFEAYGHKANGAVSEETAPFGPSDPDGTQLEHPARRLALILAPLRDVGRRLAA